MTGRHGFRAILAFSTGLAALAALSTVAAAADVAGVWATEEEKSHVEIEPCGDKMCGGIIWLKEPNDAAGNPKVDKRNEDESMHSRPIIGLRLLEGFASAGDGAWEGGKIYNPEDGKTYSSELKLVDEDTLEVKGCVFVFCKTQTWTRVE
ncbi:DUF2147 domain-containing protein [Oceanibacterium hippocampi]|uniref:DUF2147 domain-containing protein n=1 Tax=Oceanibacterium hippocampi TaxID=745714 RepID=A0A1Y5SZK7_9PROT|nr:DUF2147 domain-containing protein [Oceanibacterium hippocampi]SLN48721.1 hypothetical protein OCH7691_02113 [Oceanibacterium hippocampi]